MVTPARVVGRPPSMPAAPVARRIPVAARLDERQLRLQQIAPRRFAKVGRPEKVTTVGPALATRPPTPATPVPVPPQPHGHEPGPNRLWLQRQLRRVGLGPRLREYKYTATVRDSGRPTYGAIKAVSVREAHAVLARRGLDPERVVPGRLPPTVRMLRAVFGDRILHPEVRHLYGGEPPPRRPVSARPADRESRLPSPTLFQDPHRIEPVTAPPPAMPERPDPLNTATSPPTPPAESPRYSPFFHGGMT